MKKLLVLLLFFVFLLIPTGCGNVAIEGVAITSENNVRTIKENETLQLTAVVYPANATQEVTWSSSNEGIATVSTTGLVTALTVGSVDIYATSTVDTSVSNKFSLIIEENIEAEVTPTSVELTAADNQTTCKAGEKLTLTAVVSPSNASQSIEWSSSDNTIAEVKSGVVTGKKEGTVTITAAAKNHPEVKATIELTIEPSDDPTFTKDWANMPYSTHDQVNAADNETPVKVKGVVTHVTPVSDSNAVNYYIQNGTEGYYVYAQDAITYPVELGKVYEVGGFKKYYRGIAEIVDVEYFTLVSEQVSHTVTDISNLDPTNKEDMRVYQNSLVKASAELVSVSVNTKAYSFYANINGKKTTLRVDPALMTSEEFAAINAKLATVVAGATFEFVGIMSEFGYSASSTDTQIQILKADDLQFAAISTETVLEAAAGTISITTTIPYSINEIELPKTITNFNDITVVWSSDNTAIDVTNGTVTHSSEDVTIVLTVTLTLDGVTYEKTFNVKVMAADNTVYEVVASLDLEDADAPNSYGNSASKSGYDAGTVTLGTPKLTWLLKNALIAGAANDRFDGTMSIRAKGAATAGETGRIEVQQDGEYNVVEFAAAIYGNDKAGAQIRIEYSTDGGSTWVASGDIVTLNSTTLVTYRVKLPEGAKRVAIVVVENTANRVNVDNIKLMK